ncbi:N-acetylmuramoyl-L-alanine amidase [Anaerostipes sp.]|uniref:N-acetylmuramoyl-L-alanine amidase n=1 Tax=Anaerostipes sp. TaxID=1872530 RepID=UPI0025B8037C|nr:N-acetylmuramoyl-L-alanine amidase [Anaerostipes sp.]MBS7007060.1 N-acetylmuramoyl-L-alanine amidase [Anaerostipes sp.]
MASFNISAGHNPSGKPACGAVGLLDESKENRLIVKEIIRLLKSAGHKVYDCTCSNGKSQGDVLKKIVSKCNKREVILDVSIHLNSGRNDCEGDGKVAGTEVWCTSSSGIKKRTAEKILINMKKLGFSDRGIKTTGGLYYLNHTANKAILVEVCFVDDKDDYELYTKCGYKVVARAIAEGIAGETIKQEKAMQYTSVKKKSSKEAVCWLQEKLNDCYTGTLPKLSEDGIWGPRTQQMLEGYWEQLNWNKGSYAGRKTCKALYKNRKK